MALFLYNVPDVLKSYALTPIPHPGVLSPDEQCPVCLQLYASNGCHPLQIDACGHLIGSRCFKDTVDRGFTRCLQDNQPLNIVQDFCWSWVTFICSSWWFRAFCNLSITVISQDQLLLPLFADLMVEFRRNHNVGLRHLYNIWQGMMIMPKLYILGFSKLYLVVWAAYTGLQILFGIQYLEYLVLRPGHDTSILSSMALAAIVDVSLLIILAIVLVAMRRRGIEGRGIIIYAVSALAVRILTLPFIWTTYGWLIPLALIWAPVVVYSVSVAVVLAAGWWLPRRLW